MFFSLILIYVVVSFAQFDWTVTVCPCLPQDVWTRRHQLRTIISTTRLSCKFNKEEQQRRREWSFCVVLSIHHCTQHIHRGNDTLATDKREKKGIDKSGIMVYILTFLSTGEAKIHHPEVTYWAPFSGAAVGFYALTGLSILMPSDGGNFLLQCPLRKTFNANSFHLAQPQVVKSHHFHLYLSNMCSLNTN